MTPHRRARHCSLETDHEAHEWPGGWCDGLVYEAHQDRTQQAIALLPELYAVTAHPRPWALFSLPAHLLEEQLDQLGKFVEYYNTTYAVRENELIFPCWHLHPGLVHELAALYAAWVEAHQTAIASPTGAMTWHDRWLPGFQTRLPRWWGPATSACRIDRHREDWSPALTKLTAHAQDPPPKRVRAAHLARNPAALRPEGG